MIVYEAKGETQQGPNLSGEASPEAMTPLRIHFQYFTLAEKIAVSWGSVNQPYK